ncbi:hypothetical protein A6R68_15249 [Neotoma lepida]|uniref:protein-tyrosine-phosphatase n=1 Tax=Neotoma lepida TaxID=56216 RepID=A0A1A6H8N1_NEOLE|nr:hypothetical protein A6R68_15249 [Neotoma lepida]
MSRHLDLVRSFLEQLEARDRREGAILAREFSVSDTPAIELRNQAVPTAVHLCNVKALPVSLASQHSDLASFFFSLASSLLLARGAFCQDIKARSVAWKTGGVCSTKVGSRLGNTKKNRYKDVVPYDETRVILSLLQEEGHGDYINANFIRGTDGSQAYIATQGPLPHTLLDFWRLVWEFGVKVILMACQETENGRKKCERYWAQKQEPLQMGPFCITLVSWGRGGNKTKETPVNADIILRTLQVTFQKTIPPNFSLFDVVLEMRKQRPAAVQTEEQYRFLYHTVAQLFSRALQNTSPHHQSLKENCAPICKDALSLRTSPALPATSRPPGGVLRSISVPGPPTLPMADTATYAVVQKRGAPAGTGPGTRVPSSADTTFYTQVAPRSQRPMTHTEDARGTMPLGHVPADQNPPGPDAYEEVTDGAQTGGLGFNLRIGRPKGPRDPPAEWTRV